MPNERIDMAEDMKKTFPIFYLIAIRNEKEPKHTGMR